MENDADNAVIVRAVVDLARNLGLRTVAEGVENQSTWELLTELGCGSAQGYVLARPMAADVFWTWLDEYRPASRRGPGEASRGHDHGRRRPDRRADDDRPDCRRMSGVRALGWATNGSRWATPSMARADEVGELVDRRFAELDGQAFATARLATFLIGRWLATDEAASDRGRGASWPGRANRPSSRTPAWTAWPRPTWPGGTAPSPSSPRRPTAWRSATRC